MLVQLSKPTIGRQEGLKAYPNKYSFALEVDVGDCELVGQRHGFGRFFEGNGGVN